MRNLDMKIKVSFTKIPKRCFFLSVHFSNDLIQNVSIWIAPTYRWDPYNSFGVWKRWGNKICWSTSNKQSWASWFLKKWTLWRCGIGLNILLPTAVPVVCLSYCLRIGISLWHYSFRSYKICYSTSSHIWTFVTPCAPRRPRFPAEIAARWCYRPTIKNMTAHYNSQFCVSFHCCFLQEAQKHLWTCLNGAKK